MQLKRIFRGLFHAVGLEIYRIRPAPPAVQPPEAIQEQAPVLSESNDVIPDLFDQGLQRLMQARVDCPIALLEGRVQNSPRSRFEKQLRSNGIGIPQLICPPTSER
ncbi:MAG: hypothetical protein DMG92_09715 [Acidobacteria bacterium]|nr:MAG: hypothetical protein DMG92_09715 [Acidobacteriota bacterium]